MLLYHGSNLAVERPRLLARTRALDFGAGFYLTTDPDQAARWARTTVLRRGSGVATVSVFEVDEAPLSRLKVLRFPKPDADWLRFDVVAGPVANDNTMPVLNLYFAGAYTEEEALRRLLPQRLRDQYAMKTEAALSVLSFKEARTP